MTHTARRINVISSLLHSKTYLEIGVNQGDTFKLVNINKKSGVDPKFRFDFQPFITEDVSLFEETSDQYFSKLPISEKFDLIFIDGLHTFEQVVRDFSNAMLHSHDETVIIIDDTRPSDVYSAIPDPAEASRLRAYFKNEGKDWHGDVFKTVFYLNDFWPSLNYCTISSGGNPQTIVWRAMGKGQPPIFNSLEAISRLSFFDLHKNYKVLRPVSEEDAIIMCASEIGPKRTT